MLCIHELLKLIALTLSTTLNSSTIEKYRFDFRCITTSLESINVIIESIDSIESGTLNVVDTFVMEIGTATKDNNTFRVRVI